MIPFHLLKNLEKRINVKTTSYGYTARVVVQANLDAFHLFYNRQLPSALQTSEPTQ